MINRLIIAAFSLFIFLNSKAQKNFELLILDGKEISSDQLKEIQASAIQKFEFIKPVEAAKEYNIKGRFGAVKITSNKTSSTQNFNSYSSKLYYIPDSAKSFPHISNYIDKDLKKMFARMIADHPGCSLVIDELCGYDKNHQRHYLENEAVLFNLQHSNKSYDSVTVQMAELLFYSIKSYLSGNIYFSGTNFTNVITVTKKDFFLLPNYFGRCAPGSIITFENCIYKNPDGSLSKPLTKTIKLD